MFKTIRSYLFVASLAAFIFLPGSLDASLDTTEIIYTNESIILHSHSDPEYESLVVTSDGEMHGVTSEGIPFYQNNVINETTRLQKFIIQDAWWYISDKGIIGYGDGISDLQALSIYLSMPEATS